MGTVRPHLTARQEKWFASVQAGLERDTGKPLAEWVAIARTCPEAGHKARLDWLRTHHGLGVNRASYVLSAAFQSEEGWHQPDALRAKLWTDPGAVAILQALEAAVSALPGLVIGQRKGFTAFSNKVQFAAAKPLKDGRVALGLAVEPEADQRLQPPKNESWSERLKSKLILADPAEVDASVANLLEAAWARS
jgi:ABC-type glycerol-3-phosphate transport system substrate-binding protein